MSADSTTSKSYMNFDRCIDIDIVINSECFDTIFCLYEPIMVDLTCFLKVQRELHARTISNHSFHSRDGVIVIGNRNRL